MATTFSGIDWQSGKSLLESLDYVFSSGIASDVTFLVGEEKKKIQSHKLILISRSRVFFAMLEGPLAEKGEITIPDIEVEEFKLFLRYLYTDEVSLTLDNVMGVLYAAKKYCCDNLVTVCEQFWQENISTENACSLLEKAHDHKEDKLKEICVKMFDENFQTIAASDSFTKLCCDCITIVFDSDDLRINESTVYQAALKWSEAECVRQKIKVNGRNKRKCLGNAIYSIRFPVMDEDFFLNRVCFEELLSGDEVLEIINYRRNRSMTAFNTKLRPSMKRERYSLRKKHWFED